MRFGAFACGAFACVALGGAPAKAIDFSHAVVPLLRVHCGKCHTGDAKQGGFSMNTRASVLAGGDSGTAGFIEGKSATSEIIARITSTDPEYKMPAEGKPLSAEAIAVLRQWIDEMAPWEDGFAFKTTGYEPPLTLQKVELPAVQDSRSNPIDRVIDAYWQENQIRRPARSDDRTFIRRVSLDLVGLLPASKRVKQFVADSDPAKRTALVRELLANNLGYAEHWMTFWNDLLRNDYTGTGFITGGRRQITPWLHRSLVANMPYDQFVRQLVSPNEESRGFIDGIVWRGEVNASQTVPVQFAQSIGQTFLGINLKCASCHDSFVDRWTLKQTYDLAAISTAQPLELHRCDKATGVMATPAWLFEELGQIDPTAPPPKRLEQLAALITRPENGWLSRNAVNRLWHRLMGRGLVHPVDSLRMRPWSEDLLEVLAGELVTQQWDVKQVLELICTSEAYAAVTPAVTGQPQGADYRFGGPLPRRMTAEQFTDAVWQLTLTAPAKPDGNVVRTQQADGGAAAVEPMVRAVLVKSTALMVALGRPNRDQIVTSRPSDLTTLEAIQLANEQGLSDAFAAGGRRILDQHGPTVDTLVAWLFEAALARTATAEEMAAAREILGDTPSQQSVADCLWTIVMLPEFQIIR